MKTMRDVAVKAGCRRRLLEQLNPGASCGANYEPQEELLPNRLIGRDSTATSPATV